MCCIQDWFNKGEQFLEYTEGNRYVSGAYEGFQVH